MERLKENSVEKENFLWPIFPDSSDEKPTGKGWFEFLAEVGEGRCDDFVESPIKSPPTDSKAGSLEKIATFCKRLELGEPLFNPSDSIEKEQSVVPKIERSNNNFAYYFSTDFVECPHCLTIFERVTARVNERRSSTSAEEFIQ
jgi:hypothetical protein